MTRKAEQLTGQVGAALASFQNVVQHALNALWVRGGKGQACRAEDNGQQVVEIMCQATGQLTQRLELLSLEQLRSDGVQLHR